MDKNEVWQALDAALLIAAQITEGSRVINQVAAELIDKKGASERDVNAWFKAHPPRIVVL